MNEYVRPVVTGQTFHDPDGSVIHYGTRWGGESPPTDSYSVTAHPERFAPLHVVADALIEHLRAECDVDVVDDLSCADDLIRPRPDAVRAVRLTPASADAAGLTLVFTGYPGLVVHAGVAHDFPYPTCGCDACDESWDAVADELEEMILGVVAGQYAESVERRDGRPWIWHRLAAPDGSASSGGSPVADDPKSWDALSEHLASSPDGSWAPWPRRNPASQGRVSDGGR